MLKVHFPARVGFHDTLKLRVDRYFDERGIPITSDWRMRLKTALLLALFFASYVFLVFFSHSLISVPYHRYPTVRGAVAGHFRLLKRLSMPAPLASAPPAYLSQASLS